ncbi:MAG: acyloxyacyl hydrolase [Phycisphaerales bacterium]
MRLRAKTPTRTPWLAALALACGTAAASAQDGATSGRPTFIHEPWSAQADAAADGDGPEEVEPRFGEEGFDSWVVGFSTATDAKAFDQGFTFSYNRFIVDDSEFLLEAGLWNFYEQGGESAFGLSAGIGFRWHFVCRERWSIFADAGISLLGTTDTVPAGGTGCNFMPRAGVGFTHQIDENIRLIGGLRWHHISNARTRGDDRNPSRDSVLIYLGVVIPF